MNDAEFSMIKRQILKHTGIDLECYKSPQVRRRLESYLNRTGAPSWPAFFERLPRDSRAVERLREFLTINVTSFFRDRHKWEELSDKILPQLSLRGGSLHAWSAACSQGAEPYSLAMLLQAKGIANRYRILGTDIDRPVLAQARAGGPYIADLVKDVPIDLLQKHFRREGGMYWFLTDTLTGQVVFEEQNLLASTFSNQFDLVLCRNVLIYFTEEAKRRVIANLIRALKPGGILFIGSTENIAPADQAGLQRMAISFYRKVA